MATENDVAGSNGTHEALRKALLDQQAILENASVGIIFSRMRVIQVANPCAAAMYGYTVDEMRGLRAIELYPSREDYESFGAKISPVLSSGQPVECEHRFKRKDGSVFLCRVRAKAVDTEHTDEGTIWIVEDVTEERRAQEMLRQAQYEVEAIMTNASVGILFTKNRRITRYNRRCAEMFGFEGDNGLDLPGVTLYPSQEAYDRLGAQASPLLSAGKPFLAELEMRRMDGSTFWAQLIGYVLSPEDPSRGTIWIIEDRSEHKRAEEALRNAVLENQAILDNALIGIAMTERGRILRCNAKMEEILGYGRGEIAGRPVRELHPTTEDWSASREQVRRDFAAGKIYASEQILMRKDGSTFWAHVSGRPFDTAQPRGTSVWLIDDVTQRKQAEEAVLRARDELELRVQERTAELADANALLQTEMTERRQAEERVHHMAYHDSLTGLPNRSMLSERLAQAMTSGRESAGRTAVMFIDLDRFKHINDSLGHMTGDRLLKEVAARLNSAVRSGDTVSRQGGDEFVVVLPNLQDAAESEHIAQRIIDALAAPFSIREQELHISPSIGICLYPDDGDDVGTLLRNADIAMYQAKASGRNNYQFFTQRMNHAAVERFELENILRGALGREEFELYFQPIVDIASRRLGSMEVLLRWRHPKLGLVPPDRFIHILEENGQIVPVGEWVLRRACEQLTAWRKQGLPAIPLAVNLSPRQFQHSGLCDSIARIVAETAIDPALLELEITETALMQHGEQTLKLLEEINRMGIRLSIDDFGTGYSSLAYLKRFPVSKIKIDRAFIKDSESSADDRAIVSAIIALAKNLDLTVVAEGVETAGQFAVLEGKQCRFAQGFLFSRPVPAAAATDFFAGLPLQQKQRA